MLGKNQARSTWELGSPVCGVISWEATGGEGSPCPWTSLGQGAQEQRACQGPQAPQNTGTRIGQQDRGSAEGYRLPARAETPLGCSERGAGLSFIPTAAQLLNLGRRSSAAGTTASLQSVRAGVGTESALERAQHCPLAEGKETPVPQDQKLRG